MQVDDLGAAASRATVHVPAGARAGPVGRPHRRGAQPGRRRAHPAPRPPDARRVAGGDLGHPVRGEGSPDLVALGEDVDAMRRRILDEVDQLNAASAGLARQADDLARSNADLEQFAYVASHDLQEPLRKVSSFCQLLQKRYADQLDAGDGVHPLRGRRRQADAGPDQRPAVVLAGRPHERHVRGRRPERAGERRRRGAGAVHRGRAATVEVGDLPTVPGDRRLLGATLQNLISNALKFRGGRHLASRSPLVSPPHPLGTSG